MAVSKHYDLDTDNTLSNNSDNNIASQKAIKSYVDNGLATKQDTLQTEQTTEITLAAVATSGDYDDLINKPTVPTKTSDLTNDSGFITSTYHDSSKQDTLVSGTNIKTINGNSVLGSGDIEIQSGGTWGSITGTLSNQTDLQSALDAKQDILQTEQTSELSIDTVVTSGSSNLITSGAVNTALSAKQDIINDLSTIRSGAEAGATALQSSDVVNNVVSTTTDKPLSANMGKELSDRIANIANIGRYLANWDATTGLPTTNPSTELPYAYTTGMYYVVSSVGTTNYKPSGSSYTGTASTTVETGNLAVGDFYIYDGTNWSVLKNTGVTTTFSNIGGQPSDNSNLASALNSKANDNDVVHKTGNETIAGTKTFTNSITANRGDNQLVLQNTTYASPFGSFYFNVPGQYMQIYNKDGNGNNQIAIFIDYGARTVLKKGSKIKNYSTDTEYEIEDVGNKVTNISSSSTDTQYPSAKAVNTALGGKENTSNKVTSINSSSTNTQYPSAKAVYDNFIPKQFGNQVISSDKGTKVSMAQYGVSGYNGILSNVNIETLANNVFYKCYERKPNCTVTCNFDNVVTNLGKKMFDGDIYGYYTQINPSTDFTTENPFILEIKSTSSFEATDVAKLLILGHRLYGSCYCTKYKLEVAYAYSNSQFSWTTIIDYEGAAVNICGNYYGLFDSNVAQSYYNIYGIRLTIYESTSTVFQISEIQLICTRGTENPVNSIHALSDSGGKIWGDLEVTGTISSTFNGNLTGTATKATQDGDGKTISSTYIKYTNNTATVAGTSKTVSRTNPETLYVPNGLIMGGSAADAGLVTRGICGSSAPTYTGAANKDNLYLNYDSTNTYNASRQVVIQAGVVGTHYGNNLYQYAAARGDAVKNFVEAKGYQTANDVDTVVSTHNSSSSAHSSLFSTKQDTLVSGTNIKTINNTSILGSGDISIPQETVIIYKESGHESTYAEVQDAVNTHKVMQIKWATTYYLVTATAFANNTYYLFCTIEGVAKCFSVNSSNVWTQVESLEAEIIDNKVTSLSSSSTDTQYPSAKCVYDLVGNIETLLGALL